MANKKLLFLSNLEVHIIKLSKYTGYHSCLASLCMHIYKCTVCIYDEKVTIVAGCSVRTLLSRDRLLADAHLY